MAVPEVTDLVVVGSGAAVRVRPDATLGMRLGDDVIEIPMGRPSTRWSQVRKSFGRETDVGHSTSLQAWTKAASGLQRVSRCTC
jgi:hypothetical protein